jgi:membrane-associated phospholipid phosphatase
MFQTEIILWLQKFDSAFLIELMNLVSDLGYAPVYVVLLMGFSFGAKLQQGLAVLVVLMICQLMTESLKDSLAFPRPEDIDSRILQPGEAPGEEPSIPIIDTGGAASFFALPPAEAIAAVRADPDSGSYGIPSGHTSAAVAFFFGLAYFFRSKKILVFACFWVTLMVLSRMYLGRHFLGDIVGGIAVGVTAIVAAHLLLRSVVLNQEARINICSLIPLLAFSMFVLLLIPFAGSIEPLYAGMLWGSVATYGFLAQTGLPSDEGNLGQKRNRFCVAILLYIGTNFALYILLTQAGWEEARLAQLLSNFILIGATLSGTIAISRHFLWYQLDNLPDLERL